MNPNQHTHASSHGVGRAGSLAVRGGQPTYSNNVVSDPCAIFAKGQQPISDNLTDQAGLVHIGVSGIVRIAHIGVNAPVCSNPFHGGNYGD